MCLRHLGFVLLLWFRGGLQAQSAKKLCDAPSLTNGYVVPEQLKYAHETKLSYACEKEYKPAVEGWWATSTCQNGTWSPVPQCIKQKDCIPPKIPNAKYTESPTGWYEDLDKIRIRCAEAYEIKNKNVTAVCINGSWSSVPVCERSVDACDAPPKVPHAVIVDHRYQELFAADTKLQYECEDGYTAEGGGDDKTTVCIAGDWTEGPACMTDGSSGTGGGDTTSAGRGTPPAGGGRVTDGSSGTGEGDTTSAGRGTPPAGGGRVTDGSSGTETGGGDTTSAGRGTPPAGGGRVTDGSSGTGGGDATSAGRGTPPAGGVDKCGTPPLIPKAVVVRTFRSYVKYRCQDYYKRVGPESVRCNSDGTWSELPTCRVSYCLVNTLEYPDLKPVGEMYVEDGDTKRLECVDKWYFNNYSDGQCNDGTIHLSRCCTRAQLAFNTCDGFLTKRN